VAENLITSRKMEQLPCLVAGDLITIGLVTIFGFSSHQELDTAGLYMLTTFLPVLAGWLMVAPILGLYRTETVFEPRNLWKPFYAMLLVGPMAAFLRGAWLQRPIIPIFVVVLGGVSALAILLWRGIFWWFATRGKRA